MMQCRVVCFSLERRALSVKGCRVMQGMDGYRGIIGGGGEVFVVV